jgi:hypothetical protein
MMKPRTKPYTKRGLRQQGCRRCNRWADTQIEVGGRYYPVCQDCSDKLDQLIIGYLRLNPFNVLVQADFQDMTKRLVMRGNRCDYLR